MFFIYLTVTLPIRCPVLSWLPLLKRNNFFILGYKQLLTVWSSTDRSTPGQTVSRQNVSPKDPLDYF